MKEDLGPLTIAEVEALIVKHTMAERYTTAKFYVDLKAKKLAAQRTDSAKDSK